MAKHDFMQRVPPRPPNPRPAKTWDFEADQIPKVTRWARRHMESERKRVERFRKVDQKEKDRFWAQVYRIHPELRGVNALLKFHDGGIPYVEEVL